MRGKINLWVVFALVLPSTLFAENIDLSGTWNVRLLSCLPGESACERQLALLPVAAQPIQVPSNLHTIYPWFYGEVEYSRTFEYSPVKGMPAPNKLIIGAIGSVDETSVNGVVIGHEGIIADDATISAWNKVRAYRIGPKPLQPGTNFITIKVAVRDLKAGLHAGPVLIGNAESLQTTLFVWRTLREHLFAAVPVVLFIIMCAFLLSSRYWQKGEGNAFLIAAFASYIIHSFYFVALPVPTDYLAFLKIQWSGRLASVAFTTLYFLGNFGVLNWRSTTVWLALGAAFSIAAFLPSTYAGFAKIVFWEQTVLLLHLIAPLVYWRQMKSNPRRDMYLRFFMFGIPVGMLYINDALLLSYQINTPFLYHYLGLANAMNFIDHYSYHLYLWRFHGHREAQVTHLKEKLRMAHELHDVVGAELAQVVVLSQSANASTEVGVLAQLAGSSLEKIRNFAHILKGESDAPTVPALLENLHKRLQLLGRFEVQYLANPADVYLQASRHADKNGTHAFHTSALEKITPFARMHIERILSEWSSNVIRHGKSAKRLVVGWQIKNQKLRIFFFQNAAPFSWRGGADRGGLKSLEQRADEIGGRVFCRERSNGCVFMLVVPLGV